MGRLESRTEDLFREHLIKAGYKTESMGGGSSN